MIGKGRPDQAALRLSKKWPSHFFEKDSTQAGPRFLGEKSAHLA